MESVTCLRCRSATPPILMHQDRPDLPAANFRIILCGPSYPVVGLPLLDRSLQALWSAAREPLY